MYAVVPQMISPFVSFSIYWFRSLSISSWNRFASSSAAAGRLLPAAAAAAALLLVHAHAHVAVGLLGALQARERLLLARQRALRVARLQLLLGALHRLRRVLERAGDLHHRRIGLRRRAP